MVVSFGKSSVRKPWVHLTKAFLCCIGFFTCLYCLLRINTIPVRNDHVKIEVFKSFYEKASLKLALGHEYFGINRQQGKDSTSYTINMSLEQAPKSLSEWSKSLNQKRIIALDSLTKAFNDINKDSLFAIFNVSIKKDLGANPFYIIDKGWRKSIPDTTFKHKFGVWANEGNFILEEKGHMVNVSSDTLAFFKSPDYKTTTPSFNQQQTIRKGDKKTPYFILEDISQSYYNLTFDIDYGIDIDRLEIDFSGATRFTGIQPQPDQTMMSGIVYTDKDKIRKIQYGGLQLYCQFLETSTLQSVRIFVLTAFSSLFFTLFWKCVYNFVVNVRWRRKKRNNAPGQASA